MPPPDRTASPESPYVDLQPAFVIGVTGNMDPLGYQARDLDEGEAKRIRDGVFHILDWIRSTRGWLNPATWEFEGKSKAPKNTLFHYHSQWRALGLEDVPIIVLSSLAPGADTIVAEAALDYAESVGAPITVHAPLPFPLETYERSTSFCPEKNYASDAEREEDWTSRQQRLQVLVHRIQQQKGYQASRGIFEVSLHESMRGNAEADLKDQKRRYLRYRASGEYIAAHCNLLLAPYDEVHAQKEKTKGWDMDDCNPHVAGAHAIVDVKMNGLTDRVLPTPNMLAWADTGPVLHMPIQRKKGSRGENPADDSTDQRESPPRALALLQPRALQIRPGQKSQPTTAAQEMGDQLLRDLVNRLKEFHSEVILDRYRCEQVKTRSERGEESLKKILAQGQKASMQSSPNKKSCFSEKAVLNWMLNCPDFCFCRYALFRDDVARVARHYGTEVARAYQVLFGLAALSICFFVASSSDLVAEKVGIVDPRCSLGWFVTALLLFGASLGTAAFVRWRRWDDQHFDYRALAEGLRVQFYWALAGIPSSVANRYGQRLFGELSWIRSAINSISFPAGRTQSWFDKQLVDHRLNLLCAVHTSWIRPQLKYFCDEVERFESRRRLFEFFGKSLFGAGVLMAVFKAWLDTKHGFEVIPSSLWMDLLSHETTARKALWIGGGSSLAVLALIGGLSCWLRETLFKKIQRPGGAQEIEPLLGWLFATGARRSGGATWANRIGIGALALGLACCLTAWTLQKETNADVSSAWTGCGKAAALAASGLLLFWMDKNFYAENHRRYEGMRDLFHAADLRIQAKLDCVEGSQPDDEGKEALIRGIQQLIESLGAEVLSENADWLIMRRTRRIEPPEVVS